MLIERTNVERSLQKVRHKSVNVRSWEEQVRQIFNNESQKEASILKNIENGVGDGVNDFTFDLLDSSKIYHIDHIEQICIDYRLRFLDSKYFKGTIPDEALYKVKDLERQHNLTIDGYKIMAPSKLFKLENADDPLLFAPMGNDYFYLIHKWGNDLHPFRKLMMWSFKSFENLIVLTLLTSIILTALIPHGLFTKEPITTTIFLLELFFMFKSVAAVVLFYGFAKGKNFSSAIWKSKFYNA